VYSPQPEGFVPSHRWVLSLFQSALIDKEEIKNRLYKIRVKNTSKTFVLYLSIDILFLL